MRNFFLFIFLTLLSMAAFSEESNNSSNIIDELDYPEMFDENGNISSDFIMFAADEIDNAKSIVDVYKQSKKNFDLLQETVDLYESRLDVIGDSYSSLSKNMKNFDVSQKTFWDVNYKLNKLQKEREILFDANVVASNNLALLKSNLPYLSDTSLKLDYEFGVGTLLTAVDIAKDFINRDEYIRKGSSDLLENLVVALKIAEELGPPSFPLSKSPSDVARAIIDLNIALKDRNISWQNSANLAIKTSSSYLQGEASIESYIYRKFESPEFFMSIEDEGVDVIYDSVRDEYMSFYNDSLASLEESRDMLSEERASVILQVTKDMLTSFIISIQMSLDRMSAHANSVLQENLGKDFLSNMYKAESTRLDLLEKLEVVKFSEEDFFNKQDTMIDTLNLLSVATVEGTKKIPTHDLKKK